MGMTQQFVKHNCLEVLQGFLGTLLLELSGGCAHNGWQYCGHRTEYEAYWNWQ
jgi:hypothetical protein